MYYFLIFKLFFTIYVNAILDLWKNLDILIFIWPGDILKWLAQTSFVFLSPRKKVYLVWIKMFYHIDKVLYPLKSNLIYYELCRKKKKNETFKFVGYLYGFDIFFEILYRFKLIIIKIKIKIKKTIFQKYYWCYRKCFFFSYTSVELFTYARRGYHHARPKQCDSVRTFKVFFDNSFLSLSLSRCVH